MTEERNICDAVTPTKERIANGKRLRKITPVESHCEWKPDLSQRDLLKLLKQNEEGRIEKLIPVRYGKMSASPFAYLRGTANVMAYDLSSTPKSGINVQCCGDCHIMNFGGYATAMRNRVFDITDFDETLSAPWEWDLKRLTTSIVVSARNLGFSEKIIRKAVMDSVKTYQKKMRKYSAMNVMDIWYSRIEIKDVDKLLKNKLEVKNENKSDKKARHQSSENSDSKLITSEDGNLRIADKPPSIYHIPGIEEEQKKQFFNQYIQTFSDEMNYLFSRFQLVDVAAKVVGIGNVGRSCLIGLFEESNGGSIMLQLKEAAKSVFEPYTEPSEFENSGKRVVIGQRLMQASSDIFLGWSSGSDGKDYYVRQLRDMKSTVNLETLSTKEFNKYSILCGWALAKSHAKSGSSVEISSYIGKSDKICEAICEFSFKYADQTKADFDLFKDAIANQQIKIVDPAG